MGKSDRIDLNEVARDLDPSELAEVVDFVGYLIAKRERDGQLRQGAKGWERAGAADMASSLAAVEGALPKEEVQGWLADLAANATPVRFNPETGEVEEARG